MGQGIVAGKDGSNGAQPIHATQDGSGNWRLMVEALLSGVAENEVDLDHETDSVQIYGSDGVTNRAVLTDSAGRVKTDATLQVADTDVSNANPVPVSDAGGSLTVDGTVSVGNTVTVQATDLDVRNLSSAQDSVQVVGPAADGAAVSGNPVRTAGKDASGNTQDIRTDTTGNQGTYAKSTSAAFADNLTNTQSFPLAEDGSVLVSIPYNYVFDSVLGNWDRLKGNSTGGLMVQGPTAHDAASAGNPLLVGMVAIGHGANPSPAVAAADSTVHYANREGIPFVMGGHMNTQTSQYLSTGTITDDNLLPAISAGTKYVITRITAITDSATQGSVSWRLGFGASTIPAAPSTNADAVAGILATHPGMVPGSIFNLGDGGGILGVGGDGEELRVTVGGTLTGGSIHFTISWYTTVG